MALRDKNFTYRDILKRSFIVVKKYKFLWFFGFFAAFLGGGGELESLFRNYSNLGETSQDIFSLRAIYQGGIFWTIFENTKQFFATYPWQAFFLLLMIAVIFIIVIWLAIVSQIALFDAANKISRNKKVNYSEGYQIGNKHFGSVLLINIVIKIILYGLFIVIAAPLLSWFLVSGNVWGGIFFVVLFFFLFVPFSVIVSFIIKYAVAYIVIKGQSAGQAVKSGWELFKKNWLISIEMAFIILVIGLVVGLVILIAIGLASVPFFLIAITALFFGSSTGFVVAVVLGVVVWFIIIAIIGSAYVAYQYTVWTFLFLELVDDRARSKLARWFGKLSSKEI
jgi:hypothetical protein